jgi:hypothetical protein
MIGFGECQQRMRRAAREANVGFDPRESTGSIEGSTNHELVVQQEQRLSCELFDLDRASRAKN